MSYRTDLSMEELRCYNIYITVANAGGGVFPDIRYTVKLDPELIDYFDGEEANRTLKDKMTIKSELGQGFTPKEIKESGYDKKAAINNAVIHLLDRIRKMIEEEVKTNLTSREIDNQALKQSEDANIYDKNKST